MADKAELARKIAEIDLIRSNIKRLQDNTKKKTEQPTYSYLINRSSILRDYFDQARKLHAEILASVPEPKREDNPYFRDKTFGKLEDQYDETDEYFVTQLDNVVLSLSASPEMHTSTPERNRTSLYPPFNSQPHVKLPPINLPKFSGDIQGWPEFISLFDSSIHHCVGLQNSQKLQYLLSCLSGEPKTLVSSIAIVNENYEVVRTLLRTRYENQRVLISTLLKRFTSLDKVRGDNMAELKKFRSTYSAVLESLKTMKVPIENWDPLLIHLLVQLFDKTLRREWEDKLSGKTEFPKLQFLDSFLDDRIHICEVMAVDTPRTQKAEVSKTSKDPGDYMKKTSHHGSTDDYVSKAPSCPCCHESHFVFRCPKFLKFTPKQRHEQARLMHLCLNCLNSSHRVADCGSTYTCRTCQQKHHTLLHFGQGQQISKQYGSKVEKSKEVGSQSSPQSEKSAPRVASHHGASAKGGVLLATAFVSVKGPCGQNLVCRAMIDQGSEASFISESLVQTAKLRRLRSTVIVTGVGNPEGTRVKGKVLLKVQSRLESDDILNVDALVLPRITSYIPPNVKLASYSELDSLALADPDITSTNRIDLLIGADYYAAVIREGVIHLTDKLVAQNTIFGWIISGSLNSALLRRTIRVHHTITDELSTQLRAFWELEEVAKPTGLNAEEQRCEDYFRETTTRDASGRFIVRLPFKPGCHRRMLGNSIHIARASLIRLKGKLVANEKLLEKYEDFLQEYESLGHMTRIPPSSAIDRRVYLPHHGVLREDKTTTKLRVVFNASCSTSSGVSLNDVLSIGPKLQTDITGVLMKWRGHRVVFSADIEKMFRQILVHPQDCKLQNILWYDSQLKTMHSYQLNTVTYGTGPAPYLAMRVIRELANQARNTAPSASTILIDNIYVDDVMFGADSRGQLLEIRKHVVDTLQSGGFVLRKWASNELDLVESQDIDPSDKDGDLVKLLGVNWSPEDDMLVIKPASISPASGTKRQILSDIASLFDPLGFLSPMIIRAKIFMQKLWLDKLGWDAILSAELRNKWSEIAQDIASLNELKQDRWFHYSPNVKLAELVGFSDASLDAYSAVVYLRLVDSSGTSFVSFVMAKSKVAPIKTISIPRLELCGAVLLKDLILHVKSLIGIRIDRCICYSDSKIVLAWLDKTPSTWVTFVSNRVSAIQSELPEATWHHVRSKDNPADLNSRGIPVADLETNQLWWSGPSWLSRPDIHENLEFVSLDTEEERRKLTVHIATVDHSILEVINHYSSWDKIVRIIAYVVRFVSQCRKRNTRGDHNTFSAHEIGESKRVIFRVMQHVDFFREKSLLMRGESVHVRSPIASLDPFIDEYGLIRVGGRLHKSMLSYSSKHPIVLANNSLSNKLITFTHSLALHGGLTLTLSLLREQYWVINARSRIKFALRACVQCRRARPVLGSQIMSELPAERCTPARPFTSTGVDYAGPVSVRLGKGRGHKTQKGWVVVFVCLATKAFHLDVVTDYTSRAFLAALDRFVARRGLPATMYSDNGTTFQGAERELLKAYKAILRSEEVVNRYSVRGLVWRFTPPGAPHFGGIWEAGVKSVKWHLTRVMSDLAPTFEELYTMLCGIEACLNSRPLAPLHDDVDSLDALTPGHFLVGTSMLAVPKQVDPCEKVCLSDRWKQITLRVSSFWKRWQNEYLHTLQVRNKWTRPELDSAVGDLVLMKMPNTRSTSWPMARVLEVYPGADRRVRVVKVKTARGEFIRPVTQLCTLHLPIDD